jgi:hypothetical protein
MRDRSWHFSVLCGEEKSAFLYIALFSVAAIGGRWTMHVVELDDEAVLSGDHPSGSQQ